MLLIDQTAIITIPSVNIIFIRYVQENLNVANLTYIVIDREIDFKRAKRA